MRLERWRVGASALLVSSAGALGGVPAAPASAAEGAPIVGFRHADYAFGASQHVTWGQGDPAGTTYVVEVARAAFTDDTAPTQWRPLATDTATTRTDVQVRPGRIVCVRVRYSTATDGPWATDCLARGAVDNDFAVAGRTARVPVSLFPDGDALRLFRGGRLEVPDLVPGSVVVAMFSSMGQAETPRFRDPDGRETITSATTSIESARQSSSMFRVRGTGTGRLFTESRFGTRPLGAVAVLPPWFPLSLDSQPSRATAPGGNVPQATLTARAVTLDESFRVSWDRDGLANWRPELSVRRGPSMGPRPAWQALAVPDGSVARQFSLTEGSTLCLRVRFRRLDVADVTPWSDQECVTRGWDAGPALTRGRARSAADPASPDGRATVLVGSGAWTVRGVPRGAYGYVYYPLRSEAGMHFVVNGVRRSVWYGDEGYSPTPRVAVAYVVTKRRSTVSIVQSTGSTSPPVSAVVAVPSWADGFN